MRLWNGVGMIGVGGVLFFVGGGVEKREVMEGKYGGVVGGDLLGEIEKE